MKNGAGLVLGLVGALSLAGAPRRGSPNDTQGVRVSVVPRDVFGEAFREGDEDRSVVRISGLAGRGLLMLDVQDILRDRIEDSGDEEGELDRMHRQLGEVARFFDGLTFPLKVYRGVLLSGAAQSALDRQKIGVHWTPNRQIAMRFARGQHDASERPRRSGDAPTLLTGQISSPLKVDWRDTFAHYLAYSVADFPGGIDPQEQIYTQSVTLLKTQTV